MTQKQYFTADKKDEIEYERITIFAGAYDPNTIRQFKELGVSKGWKCLDVGAGQGSTAQWLAQEVGPTGEVVATEIDTRFIRHLSIPNLEIRKHDILTEQLETDYYDLVHSRALLMHLTDYEIALNNMAAAVRPGGWLFIEDLDLSSYLLTYLSESSDINTHWIRKSQLATLKQKQRIFNPYFGRNERFLVENLGFYDVGHQGWTQVYRGGEPLARLFNIILEYFKEPGIAAGWYTEEQWDQIKQKNLDPQNSYIDAIQFGAWGRKPAK